jgi:plastocyanin
MVQGAQSKTTTAFSPNPFNVSLGGGATVTVVFGNDDKVTHTATQDGGGPTFDSGNLAAGVTFSHDFAAGTYTYHCKIHPNMVGTINVTP